MGERSLAQGTEPLRRDWPVTGVAAMPDLDIGEDVPVTSLHEERGQRFRQTAEGIDGEQLQALGTLASGIARELSNIFAVIRGNGALAAEMLPSDHDTQLLLATIGSATRRASQIVEQIVTFGQPQDFLARQVGPLDGALQAAIELLRTAVPLNMQVLTDFTPGLPDIEMNVGQIHRVILNLGTNAAYALEGTVGTLELRTDLLGVGSEGARAMPGLEPGDYVRLTVRETGCGTDAASFGRGLEPFVATTPADVGSSLGLCFVREIMKGHRGAVSATSEPGVGGVLELYFPVPRTMCAEALSRESGSEEGQGRRVLCVNNDEDLTYLITQVLERRGYQVTGFCDPFQAMQAFRLGGGDFDFAVLDLSMPMLPGLDLARELLRTRPDLPIVLISAYFDSESVERARSIGVAHCLSKANVVERLAQLLGSFVVQPST